MGLTKPGAYAPGYMPPPLRGEFPIAFLEPPAQIAPASLFSSQALRRRRRVRTCLNSGTAPKLGPKASLSTCERTLSVREDLPSTLEQPLRRSGNLATRAESARSARQGSASRWRSSPAGGQSSRAWSARPPPRSAVLATLPASTATQAGSRRHLSREHCQAGRQSSPLCPRTLPGRVAVVATLPVSTSRQVGGHRHCAREHRRAGWRSSPGASGRAGDGELRPGRGVGERSAIGIDAFR